MCFGDIEVCGIRVGGKVHVAGYVGDAVMLVCYDIVQQLVDGGSSFFCCFGLLGSNVTECNKEFIVYRTAVL